MTTKQFNDRVFVAKCEFALRTREFQRRLDAKYQQTTAVGFLTKKGRADLMEQMAASKELEWQRGLETIRGDVEAKYFGSQDQSGIDSDLPLTDPTT